jgi:hypothetical protein
MYRTLHSHAYKIKKMDSEAYSDEFRSAVEHSTLCNSELLNTLDVDQLGSLYNDVITSILDKLAPVKTVTIRKRPSVHGTTNHVEMKNESPACCKDSTIGAQMLITKQ